MNICWIVPCAKAGHVRDVDTADHAQLLRDGYEEFRLVCVTPSGTREGGLYVQACKSAQDLSTQVQKGGLALFGGCTTTSVHRPDSATTLLLPDADVSALIGEHVTPR